ncbi:MAG TPA: hypothetical protein DDY98_09115 [Ruminococcaceae bacterium]|nr:hypothetical protein [Oscillospiraceae bacterium]
MKRFANILSRPWAAYTVASCSAVLLYLLLSHFGAVWQGIGSVFRLFSPVLIGIVVAYLVNPIEDFFENRVFKKIKSETARHSAGVIGAIICFVLLVALLLVALIPSLIKSVSNLIGKWDEYTAMASSLLKKASTFAASHNIRFNFADQEKLLNKSLSSLLNSLKNNSKAIMSTVGNIGTSVSNWLVGILFGFCFLSSEKSLLKGLEKVRCAIWKKEKLEQHNKLLSNCNRIFIRYVGCTLLDALIIGTCVLIFMLIMRIPYAPLLAAIVAITNILPTFGPMIGTGIGVFFLVLDKPVNALIFFIFMCVLQGIDGMLLKPILFKDSLGIPAAWTLVLIIIGGKLAGILGILLSIPFGAIFTILYQETILPMLDRRKNNLNPTESDKPNPQAKKTAEKSE